MENTAEQVISELCSQDACLALKAENEHLLFENAHLRALLEQHGIPVEIPQFYGEAQQLEIESGDNADEVTSTSERADNDEMSDATSSTWGDSKGETSHWSAESIDGALTDSTSVWGVRASSEEVKNDWSPEGEPSTLANNPWDNSPAEPVFSLRRAKIVTPLDAFLKGNALAKKDACKLEDDFLETDAALVRVPSKMIKRLITEGASTAAQVIYRAWRNYAPKGGPLPWDIPEMMSFARGDLDALPESWAPGARVPFGASFDAGTDIVRTAIGDVYDVRNAWAHLGYCKTSTIDKLLTSVHRLAIVMQDEVGAKKMRDRRDKLQKQAQQGLARIKTGWRNGSRPPRHVERTFDDCLIASTSEWSNFPLVIRDAAEQWKETFEGNFAAKRTGFLVHWTHVLDTTGKWVHSAAATLDCGQQFARDMNDKYGRPYREETARLRAVVW